MNAARRRKTGQGDGGRSLDAINDALCDRVRSTRKRRGWTLEQLSQASGVSRSMLSQIERHQANPTLAVIYRIAEAFNMSLSAMLEPRDGTPAIEVIRADDRTYHYRLDRLCRWRTLSPLHLEKDVEFHKVLLQPGGVLRSAPHFDGTRELLCVQNGTVRVTTGDESCELNKGDSAYYPADVKHAIENTGTEEAVLYLVVAYMRD